MEMSWPPLARAARLVDDDGSRDRRRRGALNITSRTRAAAGGSREGREIADGEGVGSGKGRRGQGTGEDGGGGGDERGGG